MSIDRNDSQKITRCSKDKRIAKISLKTADYYPRIIKFDCSDERPRIFKLIFDYE